MISASASEYSNYSTIVYVATSNPATRDKAPNEYAIPSGAFPCQVNITMENVLAIAKYESSAYLSKDSRCEASVRPYRPISTS